MPKHKINIHKVSSHNKPVKQIEQGMQQGNLSGFKNDSNPQVYAEERKITWNSQGMVVGKLTDFKNDSTIGY